MDTKTVVEYFDSLKYREQRRLVSILSGRIKSPPCSIVFDLKKDGVRRMGRCVRYCNKYQIPFTPLKVSDNKVKFVFSELSARNSVLIGAMTIEERLIQDDTDRKRQKD